MTRLLATCFLGVCTGNGISAAPHEWVPCWPCDPCLPCVPCDPTETPAPAPKAAKQEKLQEPKELPAPRREPRVQVESSEPARPEPAKFEPAKPEPAKPEVFPIAPPKKEPEVGKVTAESPDGIRLPPPRPLTEPKDVKPKTIEAPIPPLVIPAPTPPVVPAPKATPHDDLAPLVIPTVPKKESTSQSSPIHGQTENGEPKTFLKEEPRFRVYPVEGTPPTDPTTRRTIGFFNHSSRSVTLKVAGEEVILRPNEFVRASLPPRFRWSVDSGPATETVVPLAAPGVEIVLKR